MLYLDIHLYLVFWTKHIFLKMTKRASKGVGPLTLAYVMTLGSLFCTTFGCNYVQLYEKFTKNLFLKKKIRLNSAPKMTRLRAIL